MKSMFADSLKYNGPFDLGEIGQEIGYPLYMKPFDGGQWIGVTRVNAAASSRRATTSPASA